MHVNLNCGHPVLGTVTYDGTITLTVPNHQFIADFLSYKLVKINCFYLWAGDYEAGAPALFSGFPRLAEGER